MNVDEVKADWIRELRSIAYNPQRVRYALEHLPADRPPTVLQFREIAMRAPDPKPAALLAPPEIVIDEAGRKRIGEMLARTRGRLTRAA